MNPDSPQVATEKVLILTGLTSAVDHAHPLDESNVTVLLADVIFLFLHVARLQVMLGAKL